MEIVPRKSFRELDSLHPFKNMESKRREMERIWGHMTCEHHPAKHFEEEWLPAVELSETNDSLIIKAELPGLKEKDIDVSLRGDILTIKGEKRQEKREDKEKEH